ncbi:MAG: Lrp/AsnC family transcriptional regulator [Sedimenticola sp.]
MIQLDKTDRQILDEIQRDAHISNVALAEKVNLSPSPCSRRVRILEEAGVIDHYVALLNPKTVGLGVTSFISVSLAHQVEESLECFERCVANLPEVMECYLVTGSADYQLRVMVPDLEAYERFINKLTRVEGVSSIKSSISMRQVSYSTVLPLGHLGDSTAK